LPVFNGFFFQQGACDDGRTEPLEQHRKFFGVPVFQYRDGLVFQRLRHAVHSPTARTLWKLGYKNVVYRERCIIETSMSNAYDAAYQGTRGSNSEDACIDLLSPSAKLLPRATFEDVFNAVSRGDARYGVVPVENTLAGSIHQCYDLLF